jgi:hypothetical protein
MALSRKRRKELNRLKSQAEDLWDNQKDLLDHASKVVREASRQAAHFAREEVSPRIRDTYEDSVRPAVRSGIAGARSAASSGRENLVNNVIPAMTSALGTALAAIEVAKNQQVRDAISRATRIGTDVGTRAGIIKPKPAGPGRYILIGIAVVAAAGVAYAAWQTLRADDDLWIDDEAAAGASDEELS